MIKEEFSRSAAIIGDVAIKRLSECRIAIFGVGGVGGYACEALARAGVGAIDIFDKDAVSLSNINRQIIALHSTVGRAKVEVMRERIADINPECRVTAHEVFYLPENADEFDLSLYDLIIDAVDTVSAKLEIAERGYKLGIPVVSAMGAGNKKYPELFEIADIFDTEICPLARVMRRELKKRGVGALRVVYSKEEPIKSGKLDENGKNFTGSLPYVPSVMGLIIASEAVNILTS